ncbi:TSUP family transporter [Pseudoflavonifractor sp. BIOML-A3]|uniref:Probable membrane transporter protein n=1 Tax=Lawsonibacter faecis TaxID=2763052 RepID=A0A8J6JP06_9FIRM|nr:sulfite exporter TauE/SafE family protein [Lawsonibacter faecis]MTQ98135.1 TSUP family transporter [Pseudoflavonifractor sp. BIOML-A16]MTR07559.1 TSUP family transporter [Pseudoflavonifractor sp. BIOML-A15]MTR14135.1 TSUP family transporter [Pseudoflavonifractor sp. BIOML-A17]MTR22429.1 TSUP family transporter [Pseudoflavonifractor sp. BIOML-A19]MTR33396.1 TSUP family transporter [Pseudoflavonifractor sp. BIOML-A14]MTR36696.1 TSUP family transporter [Pseudoflavonifractor sp. BIOML-A9]MTR4
MGGIFLRIPEKVRFAVAGAGAGIANGFFGGGGGMILVPLLTRWCGLDQRRAFATSVAIILPLCVCSSVIYLFRGGLDFMLALPYLAGGLIGGFVGGKVFKKVNMVWLRRVFALFILYGGVKALFF